MRNLVLKNLISKASELVSELSGAEDLWGYADEEGTADWEPKKEDLESEIRVFSKILGDLVKSTEEIQEEIKNL